MKDKVKVIIFDADDTLWDNQTYFDRAEDVFTDELKEYGTAEELSGCVVQDGICEYACAGVRGEGGLHLDDGDGFEGVDHKGAGQSNFHEYYRARNRAQPSCDTASGGGAGRLDTLDKTGRYRLILMTKGDMLDQQNKIKRSGLDKYFYRVIVVTKKGIKEYLDICNVEQVAPSQIAVVGNSFKSDIQPIIEIGGYGIHIPFHTTWRHEVTEEFEHPNITRLDSFEELTKMFIDNE